MEIRIMIIAVSGVFEGLFFLLTYLIFIEIFFLLYFDSYPSTRDGSS